MTGRAHQGGLRKENDEREEVDSRFGGRGNPDAVFTAAVNAQLVAPPQEVDAAEACFDDREEFD
jgi:hypothetical protein